MIYNNRIGDSGDSGIAFVGNSDFHHDNQQLNSQFIQQDQDQVSVTLLWTVSMQTFRGSSLTVHLFLFKIWLGCYTWHCKMSTFWRIFGLVFVKQWNIDPMQKGVSLFFSYTNMKKIKSLHHVKEHPKISNFLQFESHSSKSFKVRAISDLRDLYGNKIQGLTSLDPNFCNLYDWFLGRKYWYYSKDPVQISISVPFQRCTWTSWWVIGT